METANGESEIPFTVEHTNVDMQFRISLSVTLAPKSTDVTPEESI